MLKILIFITLTFFFVLGVLTAFVFVYLKFCAPADKNRIFEISFYPAGAYVLELKWLITVLSLFGVNDRIVFKVYCDEMSDGERQEFRSVFGSYKNVSAAENGGKSEKSAK